MTKELSKKTDAELKKELFEKKESLRKFIFSMSGSKTRNVKEGRDTKKEIARILTEINKRQIK
ncbi:50S ribosomal protein L29 [Candidatus Campbellbacteria bacterium CG22_combo_CG10-13_8_21_14_all_36_13]|uniref:Large ribosomal subunit protein uL29 n=1 Tax=Candidatus Campbellbacteria bacterium CG22_combo_CG10-13_8_21_14_all_36_13 TaxID=1974529 RepID=A0A2H0DY84_9BACT|nr:MAG: 50S ribosomal protein L29 [Candidatus Campbellbacteria bacterium CG22_combo_CG10-13_8_21_14_all_36_13]